MTSSCQYNRKHESESITFCSEICSKLLQCECCLSFTAKAKVKRVTVYKREFVKYSGGFCVNNRHCCLVLNCLLRTARIYANFQNLQELEENKTTICSPLSAEIALAMVALGCKKKAQSHTELLKALDIPNDKTLRSSFASLISSLKSMKEAKLSMANKIYIKKGANLIPGIKKDVKKIFNSSLEQLDFNEGEASADVINKWVADQTNNLIKDIVSASMLDDTTCLLLVNAIYFKGFWTLQFEKCNTADRKFYLNNSTIINVPQMYRSAIYISYGVSSKLKAKLLRMNYQGGDASMVIALPDEIEGLNDMMQQLAAGHDLMADIGALQDTKLDLTIPKFKAEMTINLKELLPKLGVKSIFDESTADIDMLTSHERLFVSDAVQKAFIEVNEAGTEAAASTRPILTECCFTSNPLRFIADRPFLYLLLARGVPLFIGTYHGTL